MALGTGFPHPVNGGGARPGKDFYDAFATTPFGNDFTLEVARGGPPRAVGAGRDP